jgi:hypothetical protein
LQLADRNAHAVGADVAQAENAAARADADDADILLRPVRQHLLDLAALRDGHVDAVRLAIDFTEFETGGGDRRVVHDRNEAGRVAGDDFEEQRLVIVR